MLKLHKRWPSVAPLDLACCRGHFPPEPIHQRLWRTFPSRTNPPEAVVEQWSALAKQPKEPESMPTSGCEFYLWPHNFEMDAVQLCWLKTIMKLLSHPPNVQWYGYKFIHLLANHPTEYLCRKQVPVPTCLKCTQWHCPGYTDTDWWHVK